MALSSEIQALLNLAYKKHRNLLDSIIEEATSNLEYFYDTGASIDDIRFVMEDYARQASQEANAYYTSLREIWSQAGYDLGELPNLEALDPDRALWQIMGGFNDSDFAGVTYKQVKEGRTRSGRSMEELWAKVPWDSLEDAQQILADLMHASYHQTGLRNIRLDPNHPRWARVPSGAVTCAFCLMLASRGFYYHTQESAGGLDNVFHQHCDCAIVPEWGKGTVLDGYEPEKYRQMWDEAKKATTSTNYREVLKTLRSSYPGSVSDAYFNRDIPFQKRLDNSDIEKALSGTNPKYGSGDLGYTYNCTRCVVAYEMRRRGFSVTAGKRPMRKNRTPRDDYDSIYWPRVFRSTLYKCKGDGLEDTLALMNKWGEGSRAIVYVSWKDNDLAHVFIAENDNGVVRFIDPQTGKTDVKKFFELVEEDKTRIMRVDNAKVTHYVKKYCEEEE
ncbi:VG15 protein [Alloscardovia macacae]|uniref:Papain fold toxin 1 n=1 Tax=Alloscardovia macacae TaxID=1160091 RepID=A0A261F4Y8_9BIFI|nr:toxin glutamine deamidase domain-containing protein [Alloscardovia macacae]OZG54113.1 Papain fold toxin 1 [Alloscardovia macacae]